jgi:hypothetical protein
MTLGKLVEPIAACAAFALCLALAQRALPPTLEPRLAQAGAELGRVIHGHEAIAITEEVETFGPAVLLRYRDGALPARRYHTWQRATRTAAGRTSEPFDAHIAWWLGPTTRTESSAPDAATRELLSHLRVERAEVSMRSGARALPAADLIEHLEDALRGRLVAASMEPAGRRVSLELATDDGHLDALIALMEDAHTVLQPRFLRGPVNPGESWTYTLPLEGPGQERRVQIPGEARVVCTFEGMITRDGQRLALLRQRWSLRGVGHAALADITAPLALTGEGSGLALFDPVRGAIIAADLYLTQSLTVGQGEAAVVRNSQLSLSMREAQVP